MENQIFKLKQQIQKWRTLKMEKEKLVKAQQFELAIAVRLKERKLLDECRHLIGQCRASGILIVFRIEGNLEKLDYLHQISVSSPLEFSSFLSKLGLPDTIVLTLYNSTGQAEYEYSKLIYEYAKRLIIFCIEQQKPLPKIEYSPNIYKAHTAKNLLTAFRQLTGVEEDDC